MNRIGYFFLLVFVLLLPAMPLSAQGETPPAQPTAPPQPADELPPIPRVHIVQNGDNLFSIAALYGVTVETLLAQNSLTEASLLTVGQELVVPGGGGEPVATDYRVAPGDTLATLAAAYNTSAEAIARSNRLLRPDGIFAGQTLTVQSRTGSAAAWPVTGLPHVVRPGESLLMIAASYRLSPATLAQANRLPFPGRLYPGQRLRIPAETPYQYLPDDWAAIRLHPAVPLQGQTVSIYVDNLDDGFPEGTFLDQTLRFAPHGDGYVALVGIDAFTPPGLYTLELGGSGARPWRRFTQQLQIESAGFVTQHINVGEEMAALLDPAVRRNEDAYLATFFDDYSDTRHWSGLFQYPVRTTVVSGPYGDGRSYNGGPIEIYHTGVDFAVDVGAPVFTPAPGVVLLSEPLQLRGNVVIIDHGWGVMTAFFHLKSSVVTAGQTIGAGQQIGEAGNTGLSTGPHMHWDLRIHNVTVGPLQWVQEEFP
jgi:murein DD-endopeptidase MepM/ murein hydrolase activator NlpD